MRLTVRFALAFCIFSLAACFLRHGEEWQLPAASGRVLSAQGGAIENAVIRYPAAREHAVHTDAEGGYRIPGVATRGFSMRLPATGVAWHPLEIQAVGFPAVTVRVHTLLPAHNDVEVNVPPVLLAQPDPLADLDVSPTPDCDRKSWENAITLLGMARTVSQISDNDILVTASREHARNALEAASRDCDSESPWTGRLKINELKRAVSGERAD